MSFSYERLMEEVLFATRERSLNVRLGEEKAGCKERLVWWNVVKYPFVPFLMCHSVLHPDTSSV